MRRESSPQTTKVPAENMVMKLLSPDTHQGDLPPAANMSFELFILPLKIPPMTNIPATYINNTM